LVRGLSVKENQLLLKDVRDSYYDFSGRASDVGRQLGFAGLGVVWIFKFGDAGNESVREELVPVAALIVLALACDFLHYLSGTLVWGVFARVKEKHGVKDADEVAAPPALNWPALVFFWAKAAFIVIAYVFLLNFLRGVLV
jgi:hypothetical protein